MMDLLGSSLLMLIFMLQNRPAPQHPVFEIAKDKSSITFSPAADLKVVFSSPEFHANISPAAPWEAGWTKIEVVRAGQRSVCEEGRKYKPPMGYQPAIDGGRGFSPDGKYLIIFVYDAVDTNGSDGKGYFTFLDLDGCRETNFKGEGHLANPGGGYWKSSEPHTYMIHRGSKWQETYPEPAEQKSEGRQK